MEQANDTNALPPIPKKIYFHKIPRTNSQKKDSVMAHMMYRFKISLVCLFFQCFLLIIYIAIVRFSKARDIDSYWKEAYGNQNDRLKYVFQDIHVMIFIGFGFLMTFLKRYGYSAVGFNLLLAALMIQWSILCRGFFAMDDGKIKISLKSLMGADIAAAAVLISMGAVLGQTSFLQLLIMGVIEIIVFAANEYLVIDILEITDVGGSIIVHTFGAYFGLAVSFMLRPKKENSAAHELEGASYTSDLFAMIGTVFLWIFWPSFNGGLVKGDEQYRAIINTYLSLASCTVTAFIFSSFTSHEKKFDMVHVQNSTLAGGVAVGAICNLMVHPFGAMLAGMLAGILSVCGYKYISPKITSSIRLRDTCGVHNLHGMPGVFSGLLSVLFAYLASEGNYHTSLFKIFPAMNSDILTDARTSAMQAGYQMLGLVITLSLAIVTGLVTGIVLKTSLVGPLFEKNKYNDEFSWEVPDHHEESQDENHASVTNSARNSENKNDITLESA